MRTDHKKKPSKQRSPIKRQSAATCKRKIIQAREDNAFYVSVWDSRPHVCLYCSDPLGDVMEKYMMDHVLEKNQWAYPSLRHEYMNIALTCWNCHQKKTAKNFTDVMKAVIYKTVMLFVKLGKLKIVGEVDIYKLKDWVREV